MLTEELWNIIDSRVPVEDWWAFQLWIEQRQRREDARQTEKICRWLRMQRELEQFVNPAAFAA